MPTYEGACHCGAAPWRVAGDPTERTVCDCSLCRRKNAEMVAMPAAGFELLSDPEAHGEYRWNTGVARHCFCKTCGIYTFHWKRADPTLMGFNIHCLDAPELAGLPLRQGRGSTMSLVKEAGHV